MCHCSLCKGRLFFLFYLYTEDRSLLRIVLIKSNRDAANCWKSLLQGKYEADLLAFNNMEKKLTLERFQREVCFKKLVTTAYRNFFFYLSSILDLILVVQIYQVSIQEVDQDWNEL